MQIETYQKNWPFQENENTVHGISYKNKSSTNLPTLVSAIARRKSCKLAEYSSGPN